MTMMVNICFNLLSCLRCSFVNAAAKVRDAVGVHGHPLNKTPCGFKVLEENTVL